MRDMPASGVGPSGLVSRWVVFRGPNVRGAGVGGRCRGDGVRGDQCPGVGVRGQCLGIESGAMCGCPVPGGVRRRPGSAAGQRTRPNHYRRPVAAGEGGSAAVGRRTCRSPGYSACAPSAGTVSRPGSPAGETQTAVTQTHTPRRQHPTKKDTITVYDTNTNTNTGTS